MRKFIRKIREKFRYYNGKIKEKHTYYFGFTQYYNIPFKFPKPMPPSSFEVMKKGCDILKSLNIEYCISFGTLLGIYRDNRLIPHDSDIDVEIIHPVNTKKIEEEFVKNGFTLGHKVVVMGKVQQLAFYTDDEVVFDIAFYQKIGSYVYCFHDSDLYFKFPANYYKKFIPYEFSGYTTYTPINPEQWLEYTYGKNWKIPKTSKPNGWREEEDEYGMAVKIDGDIIQEIKKIQRERL